MEKESVEERKEKIKKILTNKYTIALIVVLIFALFLRVSFLNTVDGQALWWDEAEYMSTAKHWAFGVPYEINEQRPPLFQLISAFLLKIGFGEQALKFLLVVLPSVFLVYCTYLLGKELYNERVAIIAATCSAFMWSFLFWSVRFQPDFFSVSFQLISLFFFWKLFKDDQRKYAIYAGSFAALAFYFKISALLVPLSILAFVIYKDGLGFFKKKNYWISGISFIAVMIPFLIWQASLFGNAAAFAPSYIEGTGIGQGWDLGWMALTFFISFPKILFFVFFLIGVLIFLMNFLVSWDFILKDKKKRMNPDAFSIIVLIVLSLFYIFYIRGIIEDRWVFLMAPFIFFLAARGLLYVAELLGRSNKNLPAVIIIIALCLFAYSQVGHANLLIDAKKESYGPVRDAGIWLKQNTGQDEKVLSISYTQSTAYSEREVVQYWNWNTREEFEERIQEEKPERLMISAYEPHPDWINSWVSDNADNLSVEKAYFADAAGTQPTLIIYKISY